MRPSLRSASVYTVSWTFFMAFRLWNGKSSGLGAKAVTISSACLALILLDIRSLDPAESHTWRTLILQYLGKRVLGFMSFFSRRNLEKKMKNCRENQERLLREILSGATGTAYGKDHNLGAMKSREEFVSRHPLTDYAHYRKYVNRMLEGEKDVLFHGDIKYFAMTSGTTGKYKVYPKSKKNIKPALEPLLAMLANRKHLQPTLKRFQQLRLWPPEKLSPAGVPIGLSSLYSSPALPWEVIPGHCVRRVNTEQASLHLQAVLLLAEPEMESIQAPSSNVMYSFLKYIWHHREVLCSEVECGIISGTDVPEDVLDEINSKLFPQPRRADVLRREFFRGKDGLVKRLWPDITHLSLVTTGGYAQAATALRSSFASGVPLVDYGHVASEGYFAIVLDLPPVQDLINNVWETQYTMSVSTVFMEFIPIGHVQDENPKTLFMDQLEVGQQYEMVVTVRDGLYRYRIGDVIKIVGFKDTVPQYTFQYRLGQVLNVALERTPENIMEAAVVSCAKHWNVTLTGWTATESVVLENFLDEDYAKKFYIVFLEFEENTGDEEVISKDREAQLHDHLCKLHEPYEEASKERSISVPRLIQVKEGTFEALKAVMCEGRTSEQFKMPRVIRRPELLRVLLGSMLAQSITDFLSQVMTLLK